MVNKNVENLRSKSDSQFELFKNEKMKKEAEQEMSKHFLQALEYGKMLADENAHLQRTIRLYEEQVFINENFLHNSF